jgi:hypothetical protein
VDEPRAGRLYRFRCRCGNTIQIRAPADGAAPSVVAAPFGASSSRTEIDHPQATPASALASAPTAASSAAEARAWRPPAPPLEPVPAPASAPAFARPDRSEPGAVEALAPSDDPFAAAAAHAARAEVDATTPAFPPAPAEQPPRPAVVGGVVQWPSEPAPGTAAPGDGETSIELSRSEQHPLPAEERRRGLPLGVSLAVLAMLAAGATGAYFWSLPDTPTRIVTARRSGDGGAAPAPSPSAVPPVTAAPASRGAGAGTQRLDPAIVQSVLRASRPAFDACVDRALGDPATAKHAGRKVSLVILVAPSGRAEGSVEEPDLDATALGACLRRAAAKMSFPAFQGEPVGARVPLVLGRGG